MPSFPLYKNQVHHFYIKALVLAALLNNLLGTGLPWFDQHHAALASYVAAGLFAASLSLLTFLELPGTRTPRPRSPLEG
ncbi:hypothetical protein ACQKI0_09935, partial [Staphylococcus hominis]|uniref:hypothetical protein n=1 Tax=Staphylococcus hominis TaxID=1290 RepID=UPI003D07142C